MGTIWIDYTPNLRGMQRKSIFIPLLPVYFDPNLPVDLLLASAFCDLLRLLAYLKKGEDQRILSLFQIRLSLNSVDPMPGDGGR
jgi:hypothetical protein